MLMRRLDHVEIEATHPSGHTPKDAECLLLDSMLSLSLCTSGMLPALLRGTDQTRELQEATQDEKEF